MSLTKPEVYFLNDKIDTIDIKINDKIDILSSNMYDKLDTFEENMMSEFKDIKHTFGSHLHDCSNAMKEHSSNIDELKEFKDNVIGAGKLFSVIAILLGIIITFIEISKYMKGQT